MEHTINRQKIYKGKIFTVEHHEVTLKNGNFATRDLIFHNGASAVLATNENQDVLLVKQYRKGVEKELIEIPAGKLDAIDEDPLDCAKRELLEETGFTSNDWHKIGHLAMSPAFLSEKISIYWAKNCQKTHEQSLDSDEILTCEWFNKEQVKSLLKQEETLLDAKTAFALLYWLNESEKS